MQAMKLAIRCAALVVLALMPVYGGLVTNPGFETGMTGWTFTPASCGVDFYVGGPAHTGSYAAHFGGECVGSYDTISQVIPTEVGATYTFSFWLDSNNGNGNGERALWDGSAVLDLTNFAQGWTEYSYTVKATGSSTTIAFAGYNVPSERWNGVDDVLVTENIPEPSAWVLALGGILGVITLRKRR
jgi:hypothetical protein